MKLRLAILALALWTGCGNESREPTCADDGTCAVGEQCAAADDCESGVCDGVCRQSCADEQDCPDGQGCRIGGGGPACVAVDWVAGDLGDPCTADASCRGGVCHAGRCSELCTECVPGAVCTPTTIGAVSVGVCEWLGARPVQTLGPFDVTVDGSAPIAVDVPAGLASVAFVVRDAEPGGERRVGVNSLVAPDGSVLDNGDLDYSDPNPAAIRYPDATTIFLPIADLADPPAAGTYTLTAGRWDIDRDAEDPFIPTSGRVYVDVVYEWAGEAGGLLDLNVFVSPAVGVPPRIDDEYLTAMLDVVQAKFVDAGIALGKVTPVSIPAEYDDIQTSEEVRALCREHSLPGPFQSAVNVFLVDRLEFAYGFTGGTPSPPGLFGHAPSGVVVDAGGDAAQTGVVVAHEIGHYLGLSHTTSFNPDGSVFATDAISDTPECGSMGACPDEPNLMYPTIDFGEPNDLSAGQLAVLSRSPLLYEFVRPDRCEAWPARDITITRRAAGILDATGTAAGSCGGVSGEAVHLVRLEQPAMLTITASGGVDAVWVRSGGCEGEEVACAASELTVQLDAQDHYVFVDGTGAYQLDVAGP